MKVELPYKDHETMMKSIQWCEAQGFQVKYWNGADAYSFGPWCEEGPANGFSVSGTYNLHFHYLHDDQEILLRLKYG